jgi:hypothetical protein
LEDKKAELYRILNEQIDKIFPWCLIGLFLFYATYMGSIFSALSFLPNSSHFFLGPSIIILVFVIPLYVSLFPIASFMRLNRFRNQTIFQLINKIKGDEIDDVALMRRVNRISKDCRQLPLFIFISFIALALSLMILFWFTFAFGSW